MQGIIDRTLWNEVQKMLDEIDEEHRNGIFHRPNEHYLYGKIICGNCNMPYVRKTVISKGERVRIWKCKDRLRGIEGKGCKNAIIKETEIIEAIEKELGMIFSKRVVLSYVEQIIIMPNGFIKVKGYIEKMNIAV